MYNNMQGQGWGRPQQQPMQPQMTGYPQQPQQQGSGFLQPQQTGYPGISQFQRPMQTDFGYQQQQHQQPQGLAPQQTGMMGGMAMQSIRPQGNSNFLSLGPTGMGMGMAMGSGLQPQQTGYMGGLQPQQTGYIGGMGGGVGAGMGAGGLQMQQTGLMPQMTGIPIRDPRMQLMSAQFLPASQPFSGAPMASNMNFSQASMQPSNFQSQIQNLSQQQQGLKEPKIPWALSKEERKSYDSIFRAWDAQGTGFISGDVAREVFGQSGLETEKLMQIWHLADTSNRGKLNINEFHVAMGLIYRALNGNEVPETLPSELIPPSAKDLNDSVDFLKDLLKKDTNVRHSTGLNIPEAGSNSGASYAKTRSFHENPVAPKKDATAYKHDDAEVPGYKSSSRHLDRKTVRYEGQSATDDLSEMKRQLENTQKMLDKQGADDDEDRELEREMDDLRYRIRRIQDDIEYYNRRGGRDSADLRRKAERELMHLMHERLPQLEKRIEAKESRQRDRKLGESRERDRRNDPYSRYSSGADDRDHLRGDDRGSSRSGSALGDGEYLRSTFERDSDRRNNDRYDDRDSYRRRDDDRDRDIGRSAPSSSSAPPPPPPAEPVKSAAPSPAPSTPAASSGPPKNMTPEERAAWIRSEAQRRVQERMRMLGAVAPAGPTPVDTSVEDRLKAEQAEAAAKSAQADQEAAEREEARKARLEEQRLQTEKTSLATVKKEIKEAEKGDNPPPAPIAQAAKEQINDQEDMIRRREEVLAKEKAEREARLKKLEEQEEEARRQEEAFKERQNMFSSGAKSSSSALPHPSRKSGKSAAPPPPPPSRSRGAPTSAPAPAPPTSLAPPALEAPSAPARPSPSGGSSTNPFHRMQQGAGGAAAASPSSTAPPAPAASTPGGGTNPFFRSQQGQQSSADPNLPLATRATPPVSAQPTGATPTSTSRTIHTAPKHDDDDWEESDKEEDDDDADGPGSSTRATRQNLAQALFSNLIPSSGRSTPPASASAAPPAPPAPPAAPAAPPAPAAPAAPAAPVIKPASGPVDRSALLGQIQGGLSLKKAQTVDRSKPLVTGSVIGDATPPVQSYVPPPSPPAAPEPSSAVAERSTDVGADGSAPLPPPPAPPAPPMPGSFDAGAGAGDFAAGNPNRQSVDWANSLANDQANTKAAFVPDEPSVREEAEEDSPNEDEGPEDLDPARKPANGHAASSQDEVEGFDLSHTVRVRTLYGYSGQRDEDLTFEENDILSAHPPKDTSSDWWYGSLASGSKKGFFPRSYVEPIEMRKCNLRDTL